MNKVLFTFGFLIILLNPFCYSQEQGCEGYMLYGKYKGQCIDTSQKKAIKILSQNSNSIVIKNLHKKDSFYIANIPLNSAAEVNFLVVDLNAKPINKWSLINVAHTELRIKFKKNNPIKLYNINDESLSNPIDFEDDIIISMNYMAPKGINYNPVKGLDETLFASVIQVFSTSDEVKRRFTQSFLNVYKLPLNLKTTEIDKIISKAMNLSDKVQYSIPYDTWSSNCTNILFDLIDEGLQIKNIPKFKLQVWWLKDTSLKPAIMAFHNRKLLNSDAKVSLMNEEFGFHLFPSNSNNYFNSLVDKHFYINND